VGALVQANYGEREQLRIDGVPVGDAIPTTDVPSPRDQARVLSRTAPGGSGSIIIVLGTDAPLLPHQGERLAQRASLGLARMGSTANHSSGDLFLAFANGKRGLSSAVADTGPVTHALRMVPDQRMTPLFHAAVEATEAAIVNALLAAETLTGRDGVTAHRLDPERLLDVMARYGRGPRATSV
jgi:D-aminopeptidase